MSVPISVKIKWVAPCKHCKKTQVQKGVGRVSRRRPNKTEAMKRHGNIYEKICDIHNLYLADDIAGKGKSKQFSVVNHRNNRDMNLYNLQIELNGNKHVCFSGSTKLIEQIKQVPKDGFPFQTAIEEENDMYLFT